MSTKHSSLAILRGQADAIASVLKKAERREPIPAMFAKKIAEARDKSHVEMAVVMDDKIIKLTISWLAIAETSEHALSSLILREIQETRNQ